MRDFLRQPGVCFLVGQLAVGSVVEADLETGGWVGGDEDEVGVGGDVLGEAGGDGEGVVDLGGEAGGAVVDPGESEFEGVASTAALEGEVCEVPDFGVLGHGVEEVVCGEGVGAVEFGEVGAEEEGAGEGGVQHLVGVHGERVGEM